MQVEIEYDFDNKINSLKRLISWEDYDMVVKEVATLLEVILKRIFGQAINDLPYSKRKELQEAEEKIGNNLKGYKDFGFGQLVGVYNKTNLLDELEKNNNRNLSLLKSISLNYFVDLRNKLQHRPAGDNICSLRDASLAYECLMNWLAYLGYSKIEANVHEISANTIEDEKAYKSSDEPVVNARNKSVYSSSYGEERLRLKVQAENSIKIDTMAFDYALGKLEKRENLVALDIGCASGIVTNSRFSKYYNFEKIIAIDFDDKQIEIAKSDHLDERIVFEVIDVESKRFRQDIQELMLKHNIDKFDFVFSALTLHHLKAPMKVLRVMRGIMNDNGVIILRGADDGSKICFPNNEIMDQVINMYMSYEGVSDRLNGRKIYNQLYKTGFKDLKMQYLIKDTAGMDFDTRNNLFIESFWYRKDLFEKRLLESKDDSQRKKDLNKMVELLESLEEKFGDPGFYYSECDYICIGFV